MGAYNQGGGGGRAGVTEDSSLFALDQPFEIGNTFTAATAAQINEMFRILFKAQTRAQTTITNLSNSISTGGDILSETITLTQTQFANLSTTPQNIVIAPGANKVLVPLLFTGEQTTTVAWTNSPTFRLRHTGSAVDAVSPSTLAVNSTRTVHIHCIGGGGSAAQYFSNALLPTNLGLQVSASADFTGTGTSTDIRFSVYYVVIDAYL